MLEPDPNKPAFESEEGGETEDPVVPGEGEMVIPPLKEGEEPEGEGEPEVEPEEDKPFRVFKTEDEYNKFVEEQKKTTAPPVKEKDKEEQEGEEDFNLYQGHIDPDTGQWVGEKPANWNDFYKKLLTDPKTRKILAKQMTGEVVKEISNMSKAEREEMDKINKEFDAEYETLAKKGLVPPISTKEGQVINQQISLVGATYGLTSIVKAHELWSKLPKEHGGGFGYKPQKAVMDAKKQKAALIGGGRKVAGEPETPKRNYDDVHKKSLDVLIQERTKE